MNGVGHGNSCCVIFGTELIKSKSICSSTIITFLRNTLMDGTNLFEISI